MMHRLLLGLTVALVAPIAAPAWAEDNVPQIPFDSVPNPVKLPADMHLSIEDVREIRRIGDNTGSMALKGASPSHEGDERPDGWGMSERLLEVASRWQIEPERDLVRG